MFRLSRCLLMLLLAHDNYAEVTSKGHVLWDLGELPAPSSLRQNGRRRASSEAGSAGAGLGGCALPEVSGPATVLNLKRGLGTWWSGSEARKRNADPADIPKIRLLFYFIVRKPLTIYSCSQFKIIYIYILIAF